MKEYEDSGMKKKILKFCIPVIMFILLLLGISTLKKLETQEDEQSEVIIKKSSFIDNMWNTDKHSYKYKLNLTGRLPKADEDVVFVILSNYNSVTFEDVIDMIFNKKSLFKEEDFVIAEIKKTQI